MSQKVPSEISLQLTFFAVTDNNVQPDVALVEALAKTLRTVSDDLESLSTSEASERSV